MSTVVRMIENVGPDARARRLSFDDGSPPRVTSAAALKALGVEAGRTVERSELEDALAIQEPALARERALQLLGYRERSRSELSSRLRDSGYPQSVVAEVVDRFCEVDLVDDSRFAAAWVRTRVAAGYGRRRIERELRDKGVDAGVVALAFEADPVGGELERAVSALRGRVARDRRERERLIRRLVTRGFDLRVALEAVGAAADEVGGAPE